MQRRKDAKVKKLWFGARLGRSRLFADAFLPAPNAKRETPNAKRQSVKFGL
jgi:hypothetical protein